MKKVHSQGSDSDAVRESAIQKFAEFRKLQYPTSVLRGVCSYMAATTGLYEWINIRSEISAW